MKHPILRRIAGLPANIPLDGEEPIRAELFSVERLEQHAESLAAAQRVTSSPGRGRLLTGRLDDNAVVLLAAYRTIGAAIREERAITPAAEWLIDNFHVAEEQIREIRDDLPRGFYRQLPKLADGPLKGYPRVFGIAWAFIAHTDSLFDTESLRRFVSAYQRVQPLTIGELWAVAITLRVVLVENLRRSAERIVRGRAARQEADILADRLLGSVDRPGEPADAVLRGLDRIRLPANFAAQMVQRLRDQDPAITPALRWLDGRLHEQGTTADEIVREEHQRQGAMNVTVRNVITSMRLLSTVDWAEFFENVSLVDGKLRDASAFASMDLPTRDRYRHAIEAIARGSGRSELEIAEHALLACHRGSIHTASDPAEAEGIDSAQARREQDPGYYLIAGGRPAFEREVGFRPPLKDRLARAYVAAGLCGYIGMTAGVLAALAWMATLAAGMTGGAGWVMFVLALLPASDAALALVNRHLASRLGALPLPALELRDGVPPNLRTLVAVPTMLTTAGDVDEQIENLEVHFLASTDGELHFALLSDWTDSDVESHPGEDLILAAARDGVARLNQRYGPLDGGDRFIVLHRRRLWNEGERKWMGWERKRGKLHELNRLLRGASDTTFVAGADGRPPRVPSGVRYVITLDADTRLPRGAAKRLVGKMAHPLNSPRMDPETGCVMEGYAILQPRVTPSLPLGGDGSAYHRIFSGPAGIDPYAFAVSDVYQDLFGEGSFTGKGIYDVDMFERALAGRVPENTLLSHDLLEGIFARAGLVSDIEVVEEFPSRYDVAAARQHRWARGDWQLLPWIFGGARAASGIPDRRKVPAIGRWKMVDNLRRSLSAPAVFVALVAGWWLPPAPALFWSAWVVGMVAMPALLAFAGGIVPRQVGTPKRSHLRTVRAEFANGLLQTGFLLTVLPHQAWLMADAIVRTIGRLFIRRHSMLEWITAAQMKDRLPLDIPGFYRRMFGGVLLASFSAVFVMLAGNGAWPVAAPFVVAWLLAPAVAQWASRPPALPGLLPAAAADADALRVIARRTWAFFETFVTNDDHMLPPDNFQEDPKPVVAHRTSPTNIGLYLLSVLAARDFGWIGTLTVVDRIEATLAAMNELERFRGHFYNWYETRDLRPLDPKYVSSVDSGNLAGHLIALENGCREMLSRPVVGAAWSVGIADSIRLAVDALAEMADDRRTQTVTRGQLADELAAMAAVVAAMPPTTSAGVAELLATLEIHADTIADIARTLIQEPTGGGPELRRTPGSDVLLWVDAIRTTVHSHERDLLELMPWARIAAPATPTGGSAPPFDEILGSYFEEVPILADLPARCDAARAALEQQCAASADLGCDPALDASRAEWIAALAASGRAARTLERRLSAAADAARAIFDGMEFGFLFDSSRQLLSIGYQVNEERLDLSRYDLLASEARLASFVAIAKGDIPVRHWFRLGRTLVPVDGGAALLSWSGSMFEYLMPSLVMRAPKGSLLERTSRSVVQRQIQYGAERGVPWGVSESAHNARDLEFTYQYSNFGVPGLGLKRGLGDEIVVAPYATALASMVDAAAAAKNFTRLSEAGGRGRYGYYEALDYTPARLPEGKAVAVVRAYMAHHQGMAIVAIANALGGGAMRARFHSDALVQAAELLLQERNPREAAVVRARADEAEAAPSVRELAVPMLRRFHSPHGRVPRTHLFSNGGYAVMLTNAGSGYSRWRDLAVTRWKEDSTCDGWGSYVYLRDAANGAVWSAGFQPTGVEPDSYDVAFAEDHAEITRRDGTIVTRLDVAVSPEDDAEVRRVSVTNLGGFEREIELTSYAEIVLAAPAADAAHPAFSKLFVETEFVANAGVLLATRRQRSPEDLRVWAAHLAVVEGESSGERQYETDRARFIGRGHGLRRPVSVIDGRPLSGTAGAVLDPIFSLRCCVRIPPGATVRVAFWTLMAPSRAEALDLADKHRDSAAFARATTLAWTQAQVQLHHLGIDSEEANLFQRLANHVLYSDPALRPSSEVLKRNGLGPQALWAHGISGDRPIVLVRIDEVEDLEIVRQLLRAHEYWRMKRLAADLVILNERPSSYANDLQGALEAILRASQARRYPAARDTPGDVFILRADLISVEVRILLESIARASLLSRRGSLFEQVYRTTASASEPGVRPRPSVRPAIGEPASKPTVRSLRGLGRAVSLPDAKKASSLRIESRPEPSAEGPVQPQKEVRTDIRIGLESARPGVEVELEFFNGLGGFGAGGREYVTRCGPGQTTPAPWINVIANSSFGFQVSADGAGYTWSGNSRENLLTPWSNDPVSDRPGEVIYVRDEDDGSLWGSTASPIRAEASPYVCRHGQGYSRFEHAGHGLELTLTQFVPLADPVKISRLVIRNPSARPRRLSITAYVEWVLSRERELSAPHIVTEIDPLTGAMLARNHWRTEHGARVAFADLAGQQSSWTGDRKEFLGRNGGVDQPVALVEGVPLSLRVGAGFDPCGVLQQHIEIAANSSAEVVFLLGEGATRADAQELVARYRTVSLDAVFESVCAHWDNLLGTVQVKTPDRALDILVNRWLLYQTLACRVWARSAFYQASGAYGFRDQLQDVLALTVAAPEIARAQIVRAAGRQFAEGDVQHWWLPPSGQGVRTHVSDDRVWLPYAVAHYLEVTGDLTILDEQVAFLEGPVLGDGDSDLYFQPMASDVRVSVFEHCAMALDRSLAVGEHGLPLMGGGDWNDGMNRVGAGGRGESVWLGWFLHMALCDFAKRAAERGEGSRAMRWRERAAGIVAALEGEGWDGAWYRRGYYDDGTPLGSASSNECRIDSIAQSWAVLSGAGDPERALSAMASVDRNLVRRDDGIVLLFAPPFDARLPTDGSAADGDAGDGHDPGYIKGYPPGIRENGGQYTHAAIWSAIAFAKLGDGGKAAELLAMLNPIHHASTRKAMHRYKVEPYVVSADVYSQPPHVGRGGWSWYTGSAAWMYRAAVEWLLGLQVRGAYLRIDPCIPSGWAGFEMEYRYGAGCYQIRVENPGRVSRGVAFVELDGVRLESADVQIALSGESRTHRVRVVLAEAESE